MSTGAWSTEGFRKPKSMYWRTKDGKQIYIPEMKDDHLLNCMKFLKTKFGQDQVEEWPIYRNLMKEAMERNIDDRAEWDS